MRSNMSLLQKERAQLLDAYTHTKGNEKIRLLVRIMDIDEQLAAAKSAEKVSDKKVG